MGVAILGNYMGTTGCGEYRGMYTMLEKRTIEFEHQADFDAKECSDE